MSQADYTELSVGEDAYRVYPLEPLLAQDLLVDLVKLIGPSLAALGQALSEEGLGMSGGKTLNVAISGAFERLDKGQLRRFTLELAKVSMVQAGDKWPRLSEVLAVHFRGRQGRLHQWLLEALKVQYADFFDAARPAIEGALAALKAKIGSDSPPAAPPSGESSTPA